MAAFTPAATESVDALHHSYKMAQQGCCDAITAEQCFSCGK